MIHATEYTNPMNPCESSGFIEVLNCKDDAGKPVVYAKRFSSVALMQQEADRLGETLNCGIVWKFEEVQYDTLRD